MRTTFVIILTCLAGLLLVSCNNKNTAPDSEPIANPIISPASGAYNSVLDVFIHCATPGATIRYTLDGSDPTSQSTQYTGLLQVNSDTLLKARAFKPGWIASSVVSAEYMFSSAAVANPVISPFGGNFILPPEVAITCATAGASIRYTLDGSEPDESSTLYTAPFTVTESATVKAKAYLEGLIPSIVVSAVFSMQLPMPQFSPDEGYYPIAQMIKISSTVAGAQIRYTLDGSEPDENSALYTSMINIPTNTVIKAKAYKADWVTSETASSFYIINLADQMQLVEGGTFHNGTSNVSLSSFYIGKREVTELEWVYIMVDTLSIIPEKPEASNDWGKAIEYCNLRSIAEGYQPCYTYDTYGSNPSMWPEGWSIIGDHSLVNCNWNANGYRLPTEMEWMYAAKGAYQTHDYIYSGSNTVGDVAWYNGNSSGEPSPVATKAPNELGLYDMSGNLWEFCWDIYHNEYPASDVTDPTGPTSGYVRVMRGGSWSTDASNCTVSRRFYTLPYLSADAVGFRVVRKY